MNTVDSTDTDLFFTENFKELTKISSSEAPNASPFYTRLHFIWEKGFILILEVYEVSWRNLRQLHGHCFCTGTHSFGCCPLKGQIQLLPRTDDNVSPGTVSHLLHHSCMDGELFLEG